MTELVLAAWAARDGGGYAADVAKMKVTSNAENMEYVFAVVVLAIPLPRKYEHAAPNAA